MPYYVYIMARARNSTFYTGVTSNLIQRIYRHKHKLVDGFTKTHDVRMLVYYEVHDDVNEAIKKEKLIKKWRRSIKYQAISRMNPRWEDLFETLM